MVIEELENYQEENPSQFGVLENNFDEIYGALAELREWNYLKANQIREKAGISNEKLSPSLNALVNIGLLEVWSDSESSAACYRGCYAMEDLDDVRAFLYG